MKSMFGLEELKKKKKDDYKQMAHGWVVIIFTHVEAKMLKALHKMDLGAIVFEVCSLLAKTAGS